MAYSDCAQGVVVLCGDTVLAVVAAELSEERDRLLGALGDEFAEHPAQRLGERGCAGGPYRGGTDRAPTGSMANQQV